MRILQDSFIAKINRIQYLMLTVEETKERFWAYNPYLMQGLCRNSQWESDSGRDGEVPLTVFDGHPET